MGQFIQNKKSYQNIRLFVSLWPNILEFGLDLGLNFKPDSSEFFVDTNKDEAYHK
jgi:hypothetical protein